MLYCGVWYIRTLWFFSNKSPISITTSLQNYLFIFIFFLLSHSCRLSFFIRKNLENGIKAQEQGEVKNKGTDNEIQSVRGSYSYTGPDGVLYEVTYIADENGFQPMVKTKEEKFS